MMELKGKGKKIMEKKVIKKVVSKKNIIEKKVSVKKARVVKKVEKVGVFVPMGVRDRMISDANRVGKERIKALRK